MGDLAGQLVEARRKLEGLQARLSAAQAALDAANDQLEVSEAKTRACQQQAAAAAAAAQPSSRPAASTQAWLFGGSGAGAGAGNAGVLGRQGGLGPVMQAVAAFRALSISRASRQLAVYARGGAAAVAGAPGGAGAVTGGAAAGAAGAAGAGRDAAAAPDAAAAAAAAVPAANSSSVLAALHGAAYPLLNVASSIGSGITGVVVAGVGSSAAVALGTSLGLLRLGLGVVKFLVQVRHP
jgi:hypothetical protein